MSAKTKVFCIPNEFSDTMNVYRIENRKDILDDLRKRDLWWDRTQKPLIDTPNILEELRENGWEYFPEDFDFFSLSEEDWEDFLDYWGDYSSITELK